MAADRFIPIVLAAASLGGCRSPVGPSVRGVEKPATELQILWQASGTYSHASRAMRLVIRDAAGLARVPLTEVPVDFDTQMILVACFGPAQSPGHAIRIDRVRQVAGRIEVEVHKEYPPAERPGPRRLCSPWHVVVVPRSDLNVKGFSPSVPDGGFNLRY